MTEISRREFVLGGVALAGASALSLAGCGAGTGSYTPNPPNVWAPVSIEGLVLGVPRWVEFDTTALAIEGAGATAGSGSATTPSSASLEPTIGQPTTLPTPPTVPVAIPPTVPVAIPSGSPADGVPSAKGAAWLTKQPDGQVLAFVPFCTHQLCLYDWDAKEGDFHCRCHEGRFNLAGVPTAGPPPRPLWRCATRATTDPNVIEVGWYRKP